MHMTTGWKLLIALVVFFGIAIGVIALVSAATRRERMERRRERLMTAFLLPQDAAHNDVIRHYLRLVLRARYIGFVVAAVITLAGIFLLDSRLSASARSAANSEGPGSGAAFAMEAALWYTGWLVGGAVAAAVAMRTRGSHRARALLVARDATAYVPRACVGTTFVVGPIAAVGALVSLLVGSHDDHERISLVVALVVALAAMAIMIPLANRLAQMRMPVDAERDPRLDQVLRQVSARMVAGDAVLMVTSALAVVVALLTSTYEAAYVVIIALMLPAAFVAQGLQPGEATPWLLRRWVGAPKASGV